MNVFDGDPNKLSWRSGEGTTTILGLFRPGHGFLKETAISGKAAPSDNEFNELMEKGKLLSLESGVGSVFIIMRRIKRAEKIEKIIPFAEYNDGDLLAFCRPPWRKGQGIM